MGPARSKPQRIVLDTSLFVNPEVRAHFGRSPTEALGDFLSLASRIPGLEFFMPSSTFSEMMNFVSQERMSGDLLTVIQQKSPSKYEMTCPALFLYELVEDMRDRVNKGLRVAEKAVRGVQGGDEKEVIKGLRRSYRDVLREGIIDSREDVDLILLAKELDALLVSVDNGVITWAEKLGIKWLVPTRFKEYLESLLNKEKAGI